VNGNDNVGTDLKSVPPIAAEDEIPLKTSTRPIIIVAFWGLMLSFGVLWHGPFLPPLVRPWWRMARSPW
jgi:hypothetical protein